jgi:hypothetical protein
MQLRSKASERDAQIHQLQQTTGTTPEQPQREKRGASFLRFGRSQSNATPAPIIRPSFTVEPFVPITNPNPIFVMESVDRRTGAFETILEEGRSASSGNVLRQGSTMSRHNTGDSGTA